MTAATSFITQFARRPKSFPNVEVSRRLHSKTALERRLVLPIDSGNWIRALEVLNAKYAVAGRAAHHVQQVLECMVPPDTSPRWRDDVVPVVDAMRDRVYDGALPSSPSLWVCLVRVYGRLGALDEALEAVGQWKRRSASQRSGGWHHRPPLDAHRARDVCGTLLPLLAARGRSSDMEYLLNQLLPPVERQAPQYQQWLREASAVRGDWRAALSWSTRTAAMTERHLPSSSTGDTVASPAAVPVEQTGGEGISDAASGLQALRAYVARAPSLDAVARVLSSMAVEGQWVSALQLYAPLMDRASSPPCTPFHGSLSAPVCINLRRTLMNQLGSAGQWAEATTLMGGVVAWHNAVPPPRAALDRELLALFFHALATRRGGTRGDATIAPTGTAAGMEHAEVADRIIRAMDALCCHSEDWRVDNVVGALCTEALVQRGHWIRALHFIGATPLLQGRAVAVPSQPPAARDASPSYLSADKAAERQLAQLLYHLHGRVSPEAKAFTLRKYPHAFPKDVFRSMPPLDHADAGTRCAVADDDAFEAAVRRNLTVGGVVGGVGQHAAGPTTTRLAERAERALRDRLLEVEQDKWRSRFASGALGGGNANPHSDPRPIPLGLHDTANGWNHVGRAGNKVFSNGGGAHANLLSTHPKHMPLLKDPLRSWDPKKSSSWAHLAAVRKWNGRSAV